MVFVCNGVCINYGAKRAKRIIENCNYNRKNNGLCIKHGAEKYICKAENCEKPA